MGEQFLFGIWSAPAIMTPCGIPTARSESYGVERRWLKTDPRLLLSNPSDDKV